MEAWSIDRYRDPLLAIDQIRLLDRKVLLERRSECYEVEVQGGTSPQVALSALQSFRSAGSPQWHAVRRDVQNPWRPMLTQLDQLGLVIESDLDIASRRSQDVEYLEEACLASARWIRAAEGLASRVAFARNAHAVMKQALKLLEGRQNSNVLRHTDNFYLDVLGRLFRHWSYDARLSLATAARALAEAFPRAAEAPRLKGIANKLIEEGAGGILEPRDARMHLATMSTCLFMSASSESGRICTFQSYDDAWQSGTNLMIRAEHAAAAALEELGLSPFHDALLKGQISRDVAAGIYVEQFHLSRRFVEILGPIMCQRLRCGLRELVFQYYAEEVGHESFEKQAALSLGVTEDELNKSLPLPLFAAYIDLLTDMARTNPVSLLVCILVTEGFPGTRTPINDALKRAGLAPSDESVTEHENVNVNLHHSTIPRLLLAEIPAIDPASQRTALADLVMMIELNHRAWQMLLGYYTASLPFPNQWMSVPPHRAAKILSLSQRQ